MRNTKKLLLTFLSLFWGVAFLLTGCIYDDLSECPRPFFLKVKAIDADNKDITSGVLCYSFSMRQAIASRLKN